MQLLFRQSGTVLFHWKFITIYSEGVLIALIVSIRLLILLLVVSLLFDIPFYNFVLALRDWKFPYEICLMIASTFSFLRLFEKQFRIMKDQLKIREISFRKIPIFRKSKAFSTIVFPVLAQAMHTVRSRAIALDLKGFRLHPTRTDYISHKLKWVDYLVQILAFLLFIAVVYFLIIK
jgi:energy-coupling factor transport system permease protein